MGAVRCPDQRVLGLSVWARILTSYGVWLSLLLLKRRKLRAKEGKWFVWVHRTNGWWSWNSALLTSGLVLLSPNSGRSQDGFISIWSLILTKEQLAQGDLLIFFVAFHLLVCLLSGRGFVGINEINGFDFSKWKKHYTLYKASLLNSLWV